MNSKLDVEMLPIFDVSVLYHMYVDRQLLPIYCTGTGLIKVVLFCMNRSNLALLGRA